MRNNWFIAATLALGLLGAGVANADVLADIKKKGTLVVGSKADYRPFGYLDPSGKIIGFEPDLAADVASASASSWSSFLSSRRIASSSCSRGRST